MKLKIFSFLVLVACGADAALVTGRDGAALVDANGNLLVSRQDFINRVQGPGFWTKSKAIEFANLPSAKQRVEFAERNSGEDRIYMDVLVPAVEQRAKEGHRLSLTPAMEETRRFAAHAFPPVGSNPSLPSPIIREERVNPHLPLSTVPVEVKKWIAMAQDAHSPNQLEALEFLASFYNLVDHGVEDTEARKLNEMAKKELAAIVRKGIPNKAVRAQEILAEVEGSGKYWHG